jgi:hypothetical protein
MLDETSRPFELVANKKREVLTPTAPASRPNSC